jgi:hypothetical protein
MLIDYEHINRIYFRLPLASFIVGKPVGFSYNVMKGTEYILPL